MTSKLVQPWTSYIADGDRATLAARIRSRI